MPKQLQWLVSLLYGLCLLVLFPNKVSANPYFFFDGPSEITSGELESIEIKLNSDGDQIGATQVAVNFDNSYLYASSISITSSVCSLWTPVNSIPPGQDFIRTTPYYYNNKAIITCGFTGAGYNSSSGLIATLKFVPIQPGSTTLSFSYTLFEFLGSSITAGAMSDYSPTISGSPTPTNTPTPNPSATPSPTVTPTASTSATPTAAPTPSPITNTTTLFDDVTVQEVETSGSSGSGSSSSSTSTTASDEDLEVVEEDNAIPDPPANLTPRPDATPYATPDINLLEGQLANPDDGEVLSVQGLRDLIIPGKSKANRTVVMINFISTLIFLLLVAFLMWKIAMNARASKLKTQHIQEMITGELASLESKMEVLKEKSGSDKFKSEFSGAVDDILQGINPADKEKNKKTPSDKPPV